jgi:hypothetical protein
VCVKHQCAYFAVLALPHDLPSVVISQPDKP